MYIRKCGQNQGYFSARIADFKNTRESQFFALVPLFLLPMIGGMFILLRGEVMYFDT
jgi:hypothetical protein